MPPIYLGSTPITKMYLGDTQLSAVYLGVVSLLGPAASAFASGGLVIDGNSIYKTDVSMLGMTDGATGSASFYLKSNSGIATYRTLCALGRCVIGIDDAQKLYLDFKNSTATKSITVRTSDAVTAGHYAVEWDTSGAAGTKIANIYYNGSTVPVATSFFDASVGFDVQYTGACYIGARVNLTQPLYGDLGEFMFWPGTFANWPANLNKVWSGGKAVDPGADASTPLGVVPKIYLSVRANELASAFAMNRGTGGAFVANGRTFQLKDEALIVHGDSLAFGTGSSTPNAAWSNRVAHEISRPIKQINYASGGQTLSWIESQVTSTGPGDVLKYKRHIWVIEGGYNNVSSGATSIINQTTTLVNALLAVEPDAKWIYLGIPNGHLGDEGVGTERYTTIIDSNIGVAALCGTHFVDLRQWLITNGLAAAGLTATTEDTADIANGIVPRQLRSPDGSVHWNDAGHLAVSVAVKAKLQALGYV